MCCSWCEFTKCWNDSGTTNKMWPVYVIALSRLLVHTFCCTQTDRLAVWPVASFVKCSDSCNVCRVEVKTFNRANRLLATEHFLKASKKIQNNRPPLKIAHQKITNAKACIAARDQHIIDTGTRVSYGITQFYLPPDWGDVRQSKRTVQAWLTSWYSTRREGHK